MCIEDGAVPVLSLRSRIVTRSGLSTKSRSSSSVRGERKLPIPQKVCTSLTYEESVTGKGLWKKNEAGTSSFPAPDSAVQGVELYIFVPQNFHSLDSNKVFILLKFFCSRTSEHFYPHNHLLFSSLSKGHTLQKQLMVQVSISLALSLNVTLPFLFCSPKIYIKISREPPTVNSTDFWDSEICYTHVLRTCNTELGENRNSRETHFT